MNTGPSADVNVGRTSPRVASAVTVASAAPVPSALNFTIPCLNVPITRARPTIPFMVIITAANTVSRASVSAPGPPALTRVTIKATSIAVTEIARTREPKRLAHAMSDDFCVIHRDEHSSGKHDGDQDDQPAIEFLAPERRERDAGNNRDAGTQPGLIRRRLGRLGLTRHNLVSVGIG